MRMSAATRRRLPALLTVSLAAVLALAGPAIASSDGAVGSKPPLRVFILAGQSNMQGHAHVRTFDAMTLDPDTAALLERMQDADGNHTVCERVWISSIGSADGERSGRLTSGFGVERGGPKIGPEFTFGLRLEERLDGPILIIKTAWGGRSLHTDFRPPSVPPAELRDDEVGRLQERGEDVDAARTARREASGRAYRDMVDHVRSVLSDPGRVVPGFDPAAGIELSGLVWFQGWNDMVDRGAYPARHRSGGYDAYSDLLAAFIRDVRADLDAPEMPVVIGVLGVDGPIESYRPDQQRYRGVHRNFREAMAEPSTRPEFAGRVVAVRTADAWDLETSTLRHRRSMIERELRARAKAGEFEDAEVRARLNAAVAETFSPRERSLLNESTSNAEYHYLGSARIMGRIGAAFADAIVSLQENRP